MHAELPAAAVSVLQEPGDQLLLCECLQNLDLQRKPQFVINWDQDQQHSPSASNSQTKLAIDPSSNYHLSSSEFQGRRSLSQL